MEHVKGSLSSLISLLGEMKTNGLISGYCLGGATALVYYWEPVQTQDLDIFVMLTDQDNILINLSPIYQFLSDRGVQVSKEYLMFGSTPVQFLVPYNQLVEETIKHAKDVSFLGELIKIPPIEYLMAIMVQTGRPKDKARLVELLGVDGLYDKETFNEIIGRFNLEEKLQKVKQWI